MIMVIVMMMTMKKIKVTFFDLPEGRCRHDKLRSEIPEKVK